MILTGNNDSDNSDKLYKLISFNVRFIEIYLSQLILIELNGFSASDFQERQAVY